MLILSRRIGESIIIGDAIEVRILRVIDYEIRLGITAPRQIAVHREEIYRRILRERTGNAPPYLRTK